MVDFNLKCHSPHLIIENLLFWSNMGIVSKIEVWENFAGRGLWKQLLEIFKEENVFSINDQDSIK